MLGPERVVVELGEHGEDHGEAAEGQFGAARAQGPQLAARPSPFGGVLAVQVAIGREDLAVQRPPREGRPEQSPRAQRAHPVAGRGSIGRLAAVAQLSGARIPLEDRLLHVVHRVAQHERVGTARQHPGFGQGAGLGGVVAADPEVQRLDPEPGPRGGEQGGGALGVGVLETHALAEGEGVPDEG